MCNVDDEEDRETDEPRRGDPDYWPQLAARGIGTCVAERRPCSECTCVLQLCAYIDGRWICRRCANDLWDAEHKEKADE